MTVSKELPKVLTVRQPPAPGAVHLNHTERSGGFSRSPPQNAGLTAPSVDTPKEHAPLGAMWFGSPWSGSPASGVASVFEPTAIGVSETSCALAKLSFAGA